MCTQHFLLANAVAGREEDFAAWYRDIHIPEVLRFRLAALAAQLYCRSQRQMSPQRAAQFEHRFLGLFEGTDPQAMTGVYGSPDDVKMQMSDAADHSAALGGGYFESVIQHTKTPGEFPDGFLITEWIEPESATPEAIDRYVHTRFPGLMAKRPVMSGWFGKQASHQLFAAPRPSFAASYKVSDLDAALAGWDDPGADQYAVICYRPIGPRTTKIGRPGALPPTFKIGTPLRTNP